MIDKFTLRLTPADATNMRVIAASLQASARSPFVDRTTVVRTALMIAARMAEAGTLLPVQNGAPAA